MVTFLERPSLVPSDLIDAELDKNFGQKTVGLKGSEMDIRRFSKKDLDAINERPRAWKAGASQVNRASSELLLRPPNSSSYQ